MWTANTWPGKGEFELCSCNNYFASWNLSISRFVDANEPLFISLKWSWELIEPLLVHSAVNFHLFLNSDPVEALLSRSTKKFSPCKCSKHQTLFNTWANWASLGSWNSENTRLGGLFCCFHAVLVSLRWFASDVPEDMDCGWQKWTALQNPPEEPRLFALALTLMAAQQNYFEIPPISRG